MQRFTACTLDCPDGCSLVAEIKNGALTVRGNPEHPFTRGFCCSKPLRHIKRAFGPERITSPLLRRGRDFAPVSWDEALDWAAERIQALRDRPSTILHLRGHGYRGVLARASFVFFGLLGATEMRGSLCDEAGIAAQIQDFGALDHNDPEELLNARRIVIFGRDLPACSIHAFMLVSQAKKRGARVLVISPGADRNGELADERIVLRPGTDRFLAAAAIKTLLRRGQVPDRVWSAAAGLEAFRELMDGVSIAELCEASGVGVREASLLADWCAGQEPVSMMIGWGAQRYEHGAENVRYIDALAVLSGQIGRPGAGCDFNISSGRNLGPWPGSVGQPARTLLMPLLAEELESADPPIGLVYADGGNPVSQAQDSERLARAFERIPVKIVVDCYFTDTVRRADLVLPPALMFEREEILGSSLHNFLNYSGKVIDPPGQCRCDMDILTDLGARLSPKVTLPSAEEVLAAGLDHPCLDIDLPTLREFGFARAKRRRIAFPDMHFDHSDGRCRLPDRLSPEPEGEAGYPLRLLSLIRRRYLNSQIPEADQTDLPTVEVSPDNPCLGALDGATEAFLATPLGRLRVNIQLRPGLHPEAVVCPRGGWLACGQGVNALIKGRVADAGDNAAPYQQRARLEL
jgi:anaerobic selenocysteine-containing dehydrogenase